MKILIINGPNINMLGVREKAIYGKETYKDLMDTINIKSKESGVKIEWFQSNIEGEIIDKLQEAHEKFDGIIINPAAYTHYSIAILDAIKSISTPTIEVHISNIHAREEFRQNSITASGCIGQISGFGFFGYTMALNYFIETGGIHE